MVVSEGDPAEVDYVKKIIIISNGLAKLCGRSFFSGGFLTEIIGKIIIFLYLF